MGRRLIKIHHQDRSTLRGPSRLPVLETETHQPVPLLDQDDAHFRDRRPIQQSLQDRRASRKADLLDGLEDLQTVCSRPTQTTEANGLSFIRFFMRACTPARREPRRRVVKTPYEPSPCQLATLLPEEPNTPPSPSAKPSSMSSIKHPAAWPTHLPSFSYAAINHLVCRFFAVSNPQRGEKECHSNKVARLSLPLASWMACHEGKSFKCRVSLLDVRMASCSKRKASRQVRQKGF